MKIRSNGDVEVVRDTEEHEVQEIAEQPLKPGVDLREGTCLRVVDPTCQR